VPEASVGAHLAFGLLGSNGGSSPYRRGRNSAQTSVRRNPPDFVASKRVDQRTHSLPISHRMRATNDPITPIAMTMMTATFRRVSGLFFARLGVTHFVFAPRGSTVSGRHPNQVIGVERSKRVTDVRAVGEGASDLFDADRPAALHERQ